MFDPSSFADPTPLAHADASRDVLPRGGTSQGGNCRRAVSPLVGMVEGEEKWEASYSQGVFPLNWGGTKLNRTVCMELQDYGQRQTYT
ncbi:hypothetical protein TNCV_4792381 [Trichonephila clavipes]|nr:hypothetical protein TNCV_4792381 [Trichonephila clavipes]